MNFLVLLILLIDVMDLPFYDFTYVSSGGSIKTVVVIIYTFYLKKKKVDLGKAHY